MNLTAIVDAFLHELRPLFFGAPITHVYNPLEYARAPYERYLELYGGMPKEVVILGMNPGPWGMAQTGVPFGEINAVKDWLRIEAPVDNPTKTHPKRPVQGFACSRSEVSGRRLWGWARRTFQTPEQFFARFFVANYCPLLFLEASGRNRTPNNIRATERKPLLFVCDRALLRTIQWLRPRFVVGVGRFAAERAHTVLSGLDVTIGHVTHPSPANPKANRGWDSLVTKELFALGIDV
ncbi:MAG: single-stranded DNA-binding protein [Deltaproteobacteria bacterium]|nr:MAG: single-stranded DNA-binding protein [Deltaproteobacteria bacterium]